MSSGSTCAVVGCYNNSRKLKMLSETFCIEHEQLRQTCPCRMPYSMHSMPKKEERKLAWLAALRIKHPPQRVYVCSFHFVGKRPTDLHPDPELYLGHDLPPRKDRRKLTVVRATPTANSSRSFNVNGGAEHDCPVDFSLTVAGQTSISSSAHPPDPQLHTQREDPARQDHDYCQTDGGKDVQDKVVQRVGRLSVIGLNNMDTEATPTNCRTLCHWPWLAEGGGSDADPEMEIIRLDELSLGAGLEVQADMKEQELHSTHQQETPSWSINGAVTVETMEVEETRKEEDERWRQLYPEIKKCVVVIARQRLDKLDVLKLKEERQEEEGGGGGSGDPEPVSDWMNLLELDYSGDRFRRFEKKVEVKVSSNHTPDNRCGSPHHLRSRSVINSICQSETDHNYSFVAPPVKGDPDRDTPNSQSQDTSLSPCCGQKVRDSCSCSTEKKNPPTIVFKKVRGDHWVLGRAKVKKEKEEEEEDGDSSINNTSKPMKTSIKENSPTCTPRPILRKKRRMPCRQCPACLREDCGKCIYCLDKKKFGGPEKKRQKCRFRLCLVMLNLTLDGSHFTPSILSDSTLTLNSLSGLLPQEGSVHHMSTGLTYIPPPAAAPPFLHPLLLQPKEEEEEEAVDIDEYGRAGGKEGQREDREMMEEEAAAGQMEDEEEAAGWMKEEEEAAGWMVEEEEAAGWIKVEEEEAAGWMKEEEEAAGWMVEEEEAAGWIKVEEEEAAGWMKEEVEDAAGWMKEEEEAVGRMKVEEEEEAAAGRIKVEEEAIGWMKEEAAGRMKVEEEEAAAGRIKVEEEAIGWMKEEETAGWMKVEWEEAAGRMKEEEGEEAAGRMKVEWEEEEEEECSEGVTEEGKYYEIEVEVPGLDSDEETLTASSTLSEIRGH